MEKTICILSSVPRDVSYSAHHNWILAISLQFYRTGIRTDVYSFGVSSFIVLIGGAANVGFEEAAKPHMGIGPGELGQDSAEKLSVDLQYLAGIG